MKKGLIYLFMLVMGAIAFTACNDDDDNTPKKISHEYSGDNLKMTLNSTAQTGKAVQLEALNKENGYLALKKMIPGEDSLVIDVKLVQSTGNNFSIDGTSTNNDRTINVTGEIKDGVMTLNSNFKITSKVVGNWKLAEQEESTDPTQLLGRGPLHLEVVTNIDTITLPIVFANGSSWKLPMQDVVEEGVTGFPSFAKAIFAMMVPGMLHNIEFKENGNLVATYINLGDTESAPLTSPEGLVRYNVKDGQIYLAIDVASLMSRSTAPQVNILEMLANGMPLKLTLEGDQMRAYVDKSMMVPFMGMMDMVKGLVAGMEPVDALIGTVTEESLVTFLDEVVVLVTTAEKIEIGLNLDRQVVAATSKPLNKALLKETLLKYKKQ